jgi:hypothetical protein
MRRLVMRAAIETELGKIKGLKLQYAGRLSNLFWLGFGELVQIIRRGKTEEPAEYALHLQCSWRITLENKIVVASRISILQTRSGTTSMRISIGIFKVPIGLMNVLNLF